MSDNEKRRSRDQGYGEGWVVSAGSEKYVEEDPRFGPVTRFFIWQNVNCHSCGVSRSLDFHDAAACTSPMTSDPEPDPHPDA